VFYRCSVIVLLLDYTVKSRNAETDVPFICNMRQCRCTS